MGIFRIPVLIAAVLFVGGCGGKDTDADIAKRLESKGTTELIEEAAEDEFTPPENNLLTEKQVETYLAVREREAKIAEVSRRQIEEHSKDAGKSGGGIGEMMAGMKGLGSVADLLTADIRAAQELGYNTAEYQWIKERVLEASSNALAEQMNQQILATLNAQYEETRTALEHAKTDEERSFFTETLKGIEDSRASVNAAPEEPWIVPNRKLLEKHESALKALEMEFAKYGEASATSDAGPGDAEGGEAVAEPDSTEQ